MCFKPEISKSCALCDFMMKYRTLAFSARGTTRGLPIGNFPFSPWAIFPPPSLEKDLSCCSVDPFSSLLGEPDPREFGVDRIFFSYGDFCFVLLFVLTLILLFSLLLSST